MPAHLVENPTNAQIDAAVALCIRAYNGDVSFKTFVGGDSSLEDIFFRSILRGAALEGHVYIAHDEAAAGSSESEVHSVGVVFPPGVPCWGSEAQRRLGYNEYWESLSPEARDWFAEFQKDVGDRLQVIFGPKLGNEWVVSLIGTDPVHQKKGLGSSIIKAMCDRAGTTTVGLSTQSDLNAVWYEGLGFKRNAEWEVTSPYGTWTNIVMTKQDDDVRESH
ncbi:hypothetical protein EVG20_g8760 [Dentipellis fragilis]|uniref:N-acetyltransferase domain-containing protein n=1 Tax=Dentipellis fragilis TaxID=205917 RepID=A0A4Y9Y602_9AGAM|nr:hypothetical protein EVG20_g8760 [Dentipellis fragilis]